MKTTLLLLMLMYNYASAQLYSAQQTENFDLASSVDNFVANDEWTFIKGRKCKSLFIDLEKLNGNTTKLSLIREDKTLIHQDNHLFDLPNNTIYEIDLENLKRGVYFVVIQRQKLDPVRQKISI